MAPSQTIHSIPSKTMEGSTPNTVSFAPRQTGGDRIGIKLRARCHPIFKCARAARPSFAFTLIETLVVIAIIAILLALLVPGFAVLRDSADTTRCASNFRNIGAAMQLFFQDFNGEFTGNKYFYGPDDKDSANPGETLPPGLRNYLGIPKRAEGIDTAFTCPALQRTHPTKGYALNHNYAVNTYATTDGKGGLKRMINVAKPSSMMHFTDGAPSDTPDYRGYSYSSVVDETPKKLDALVYPHRGTQQVLFLDGHIELLNKKQFLERSQDLKGFWKGQN